MVIAHVSKTRPFQVPVQSRLRGHERLLERVKSLWRVPWAVQQYSWQCVSVSCMHPPAEMQGGGVRPPTRESSLQDGAAMGEVRGHLVIGQQCGAQRACALLVETNSKMPKSPLVSSPGDVQRVLRTLPHVCSKTQRKRERAERRLQAASNSHKCQEWSHELPHFDPHSPKAHLKYRLSSAGDRH